jgi:integrase
MSPVLPKSQPAPRQDILGHRSLNTTERYLRLAITDLKEARRKFHPRERGGTLI